MSNKEIETSIGINRDKDRSHVGALMAAGGFITHRPAGAAAGVPADRTDGVSMARPVGVKGGGKPAVATELPRLAPAAQPVRDIGRLELKPIRGIEEKTFGKKLKRSPVPPSPKVAWLRLDQLVIDDSYQREISENGQRLIRRMVENWDWARFKPLSVAATPDGQYEVVDGQHSAIAAATHGSIDSLPCLVLQLATQAERARAFVGVNSERNALRSFALFRGRLVAGEPRAIVVRDAVADAGARLVETVSGAMSYEVGDVACIATLITVVKANGERGRAVLAEVLRICVQAGVGPIPALLVRALDPLVAGEWGGPDASAQLITFITETRVATLLERAERKASSDGVNVRMALMNLLKAVLDA